MRMVYNVGILAALLLGVCFSLRAAEPGEQAVVVYNTRVRESKQVAQHYAQLRHVPSSQVIGLDISDHEDIHRSEYRDNLERPLLKVLKEKKLLQFSKGDDHKVISWKIRYIVLCYGIPLRITQENSLIEPGTDNLRPEVKRNGAAVDSELTCLPQVEQGYLRTGPLLNPFYAGTNSAAVNPANGVLIVARLDGPSADIAMHLVDKAIESEKDGLWGRAYFDERGLTSGDYKLGDDYIRSAADFSKRAGFETIEDKHGGTFAPSFPLSHVAFYAGWYDENVSGPFTLHKVEFMPGAFAYHLHSFSGATMRSTTSHWTGPLLARGATSTMGCVDEPYLAGTPDLGVFLSRFLSSDFTFGEAAFCSQPVISWQTTVVGDPLYNPFRRSLADLYKDLESRHSPLLEWYYERLTNLGLLNHAPLQGAVNELENLPLTRKSAVLTEKLADLYGEQGKPSSEVFALKNTLKLDPSPQQRIRVTLELARKLIPLDKESEALEVFQEFLKDFPDYPDRPAVYRELAGLARKMGKTEDAEKFEREAAASSPSTSKR